MATMHEANPDAEGKVNKEFFQDEAGDYIIMIKGAPERVLEACHYMRCQPGMCDTKVSKKGKKPYREWFDEIAKAHIEADVNGPYKADISGNLSESCGSGSKATDKRFVPLVAALKEDIVENYQMKLAEEGERVLGFAEARFTKEEWAALNCPKQEGNWDIADPDIAGTTENGQIWKNAVFLGMMSLQDPPRDDVPGAVAECQSAGIQVVMVTGDHPVTAKAISERIGILNGGPCSISDWYAWQKANVGKPGFMRTDAEIDKLLEDYIWLPTTKEEEKDGKWSSKGHSKEVW
jgi:magnesium-transporting ATPase (P-type)